MDIELILSDLMLATETVPLGSSSELIGRMKSEGSPVQPSDIYEYFQCFMPLKELDFGPYLLFSEQGVLSEMAEFPGELAIAHGFIPVGKEADGQLVLADATSGAVMILPMGSLQEAGIDHYSVRSGYLPITADNIRLVCEDEIWPTFSDFLRFVREEIGT